MVVLSGRMHGNKTLSGRKKFKNSKLASQTLYRSAVLSGLVSPWEKPTRRKIAGFRLSPSSQHHPTPPPLKSL